MSFRKRSITRHNNLSHESGGVAVLFAILLGSGVLLALVGFSLDIGINTLAKSYAQESAERSVKNVALSCIEVEDACNTTAQITAINETHLNATSITSDLLNTEILSICGSLSFAPGLLPCPLTFTPTATCNPVPSAFQNAYVEVRTKTWAPSYFFNPGSGKYRQGCSHVGIGSPASAGILFPIAVSCAEYADFQLTNEVVYLEDFKYPTTAIPNCSNDLQGNLVDAKAPTAQFVTMDYFERQPNLPQFPSTGFDCTNPVAVYLGDGLNASNISPPNLCSSDILNNMRGQVDGQTGVLMPIIRARDNVKFPTDAIYTSNVKNIVVAFAQIQIVSYRFGPQLGYWYGAPSANPTRRQIDNYFIPRGCSTYEFCVEFYFQRAVLSDSTEIVPGANYGVITAKVLP
ncbi:MAG: TadE/TadG family type IV pilus assembly protein [Candidatus Nanopelagicales bacterium]